jgi:hypothetical protein
MMRAMRLAALILALAACGHPATTPETTTGAAHPTQTAAAPDAAPTIDAPPPLEQDPPALAAGLVAVYEDVATAAGAGDCDAIAAAVTALEPKHAALLDALRKADAAGRAADVKTALEPYRERVQAALDTIEQKTASCGKDPAVEHAIDALFGA